MFAPTRRFQVRPGTVTACFTHDMLTPVSRRVQILIRKIFGSKLRTTMLSVAAVLAIAMPPGGAGSAWAQSTGFIAPVIPAVPIVPTAFDITGFIQEATLDVSNAI